MWRIYAVLHCKIVIHCFADYVNVCQIEAFMNSKYELEAHVFPFLFKRMESGIYCFKNFFTILTAGVSKKGNIIMIQTNYFVCTYFCPVSDFFRLVFPTLSCPTSINLVW